VAAWLETALTMDFFLILVVDGDDEVRLRRSATSLSLFVQRLCPWTGLT
jgi:hypothetical protein